jgi:hypothetical protein
LRGKFQAGLGLVSDETVFNALNTLFSSCGKSQALQQSIRALVGELAKVSSG